MLTQLDRLQPFGALWMRTVLGAIILVHGYAKIVPRGALYTFAQQVAHLGMPAWFGYVAAFTEFFGGMLLVLGLLTRVAALGCAIDMAVAILKVHLQTFLRGHLGQSGLEFPLALFAIALMLVFTGPGLMGLDRVLGKSKL